MKKHNSTKQIQTPNKVKKIRERKEKIRQDKLLQEKIMIEVRRQKKQLYLATKFALAKERKPYRKPDHECNDEHCDCSK